MTSSRQLQLFDMGALDEEEGTGQSTSVDPEASEDEKREEVVRKRLSRLLDCDVVSLVPTTNRVRFLSARRVEGGLRVRLHRVFLDAPEGVLEAISRLCDPGSRGPARSAALAEARAYFAEHAAEHRTPASLLRLRPRGTAYDLEAIRDRLEGEYFDGDLKVEITWSRSRRGNADLRRGAIHLRLGSYDAAHRLVRIHPVLDRDQVPEYVVEAIVYHEMLHAAEPPRPGARRRRVHTGSFRRREREFRDHERAERWINANLRRLARWRGSTPRATRGRS